MPHRRHAVAARLVASLGVLVALLVLPVVGAPGVPALACAGAAPSGQVRIAVVIDFGTAGGPGGTRTACVTVDAGATGADALAVATSSLRWAPSGLLCGIEGWPATGCGERGSTGYRYWAYSTGEGSSWSHSAMGPAFRTVRPGVAEGWRFVEGAGGPSDPPPRVPVASAVASCSQPSTPAPAPSGGGAPPPPSPGPQPAPTWGTADPPPPVWGGGAPPPSEAPPPVPADPGGSGPTAPLDGSEADDDGAGASPEAPGDTASDDAAGAGASDGDDPDGAETEAGGSSPVTELAAVDAEGDPSGIPWQTVAAALVIAVLGGVAALRFRTPRPRADP